MNNHSAIERIKNNDGERVLKEIYQQYRNEFLHWAMRNHDCTMEEARDVFQQTIVILYENIVFGKVTEINVQMKTYIFGIGKNKILELLKRRAANAGEPDDPMMEVFRSANVESEGNTDAKLSQLESSLRQLGEPCITILKQYYYHRKSMQVIAGMFDYKNSETVKNMKYKCLMRLKKIFFGNVETLNLEQS